jgi:hypothetical protein
MNGTERSEVAVSQKLRAGLASAPELAEVSA